MIQSFTLSHLNALDEAAFVAALGDIYEHSPWIAQAASKQRPFQTLQALHEAMMDTVCTATPEARLALVKAHPDLAGKAARAGALTADSTREQSSAGLDRLNETEFARFHALNKSYQATFGIPFIVCVRRHTRDSILDQFERRLSHDRAREFDTALEEIHRIAALRLDQRVRAPDRLPLDGRLSTHVLDVHGGAPAAGIPVELWELSRHGENRLLARTATNADGRTDAPLIVDRPVPIGAYELRFWVGAYFAARAAALTEPPFLDLVPVRFQIAVPESHYHVPLVVSPWSYATYRGS